MNDEPERTAAGGRPQGLGTTLSLARENAGLTLSDVAQRTHVRRSYLEALEEGRYADLPEDVYTRNFVRLFGQSVGLDPLPLLEAFQHERRAARGLTTSEQRADRERRRPALAGRQASPTALRAGPPSRRWTAWLFGPWLATLALVVVVVGLAGWGLDRLFANPSVAPRPAPTSAGTSAVDAAAASAADAAAASTDDAVAASAGEAGASPTAPPSSPAEAAVIRIEIVTEPAGAEIAIDGFPIPGRTPLVDVPVTARAGRTIRAELDGHQPVETRLDLLSDTRIDLVLPAIAASEADPSAEVGAGRLALTITEATWLEVYRSSARNEGERLVYTTAQPGASFEFALPVYVYVGNAVGVRINVGGQDLGPMGAPGAVLGRAFGP